MVKGILFGTADGKELAPLGSIDEVELSAEEIPSGIATEDMSFSFELDSESTEKLEKYIIFGGNRGRYNGYRLRNDGYLNQKNAWMEETE